MSVLEERVRLLSDVEASGSILESVYSHPGHPRITWARTEQDPGGSWAYTGIRPYGCPS